MGFIKGVLCKVDHFIVNVIGRLFIDAVGNTAPYSFRLIAIDEILALLLHHSRLFLTHGAAHKIASAHGIASQIPDNLHDLLLVYNAPIGRA